jgi:hypothetical protein
MRIKVSIVAALLVALLLALPAQALRARAWPPRRPR